ncbi:outer membrane lipoprotein carrier protein LolA [Pasteurellaceae bacterium LIM206]|nr:outer membrane lipoprotein carrier protein LolA [Pasteurellaceae bacterium LIM206]
MIKFGILLLTLFISTAQAFDLTDLENQLKQTQSSQGQFEQQKRLRGVDKPLVSSGEFALVQQKGLLWRLEKPIQYITRISFGTGIDYWANGQWVKAEMSLGATTQIRLFLDLLGGNTNELKKQFNIQLNGNEESWQAILIPNTVLLKQIFNKIEINGTQTVNQILLFETQGDSTLIELKNQKLNQPLVGFVQNAF